jgi:NAD(P)H dehydrogenase (quinone)
VARAGAACARSSSSGPGLDRERALRLVAAGEGLAIRGNAVAWLARGPRAHQVSPSARANTAKGWRGRAQRVRVQLPSPPRLPFQKAQIADGTGFAEPWRTVVERGAASCDPAPRVHRQRGDLSMRVLIIYAHHQPRSFCRAVLHAFERGLTEAGHTHEVVDLHAIGFNPLIGASDGPNWIDDGIPDDVLEHMHVEQSLRDSAQGPWQRWLQKRWVGGRDARGIIRKLHAHGGPGDVREQQRKVLWADALVLISPVYFMGLPAMLKGWIERVFSLGFAFGFTADGWRGDLGGRVPLLHLRKALIISTTIFDERSYDGGHRDAMKLLIDDYCLRYPGVAEVEHAYFYAVHGASDEQRRDYLARAERLGREFLPQDVGAPRRPALDATAHTDRKLRHRSLLNLSRMGHCAPTIMQTMLDVSQTESAWLVKLCAGLPGGIGNSGGECGAITAPLALLGLRHGGEPERDGLPVVVYKGRDLLRRFQARHASSACREIRREARLPLACLRVVRSAPSRCAQTMCSPCADALSASERSAGAAVYAHWKAQDFHCAGSVLRALAPAVPDTAELRDAVSGFMGGGVLMGKTCGALTAGVMALGLLEAESERSPLRVLRMVGRMAVGGDAFADDLNAYSRAMNRGHALAEWFEKQYGSTQCRALTHCDLCSAADAGKYMESGAIVRCRAMAEGVAAQVRTMVEAKGPRGGLNPAPDSAIAASP